MPSSTTAPLTGSHMVGMGQIAAAEGPVQLVAVLGSCVAVVLHHRRLPVAGLAHVVLPDSGGRRSHIGRYADTAIPTVLQRLDELGAAQHSLLAKIVGGACLFGKGAPIQVGESNIQAITRILHELGIPIVASEVGGQSGRRITLDCSNGAVAVETVGKPKRVL